MKQNNCIKCDVTKCCHNNGENFCQLDSIKVTCCAGEGCACTCCGDFCER